MTPAELIELDYRIHTEVFGIVVSCPQGDGCHDLPKYSSALQPAFTVLDTLVELGFDYDLSPAHIRSEGYELELSTTQQLYEQDGYVGCYRTGPDLPLLICQAALYSLGLETPDAD